ncbi:MAG: glycosyltransferase [Acidobacteria bacterium]|nr:glycosyltransferase [Acidobacteriota bacterium]
MKTAIVHDWLTGMRGGEKALEAICDVFPAADLFTLLHVRGSVSARIERHRITTSFIQYLPNASRWYRHYLPLFPMAVEQFDLGGYDLVVSISHCAVKSIVHGPGTRHLCYCLTPMRYAWDQFDAYFGRDRVGRAGAALLRPVLAGLARWDAATAHRVDEFVAISQYVAGRVARYYNRSAAVVYPPVDTEFFCPDGSAPGARALVVSALVPYKRIDLAIEACAAAHVPLSVIGDGPELARLERMAGADVTFLGWVSDERIRAEYRRAGVVLLPGVEDFGIVPLEAQACGRPVVALGIGGACETVVEGVTGRLVTDGTSAAFGDAVRRTLEARLPPDPIRTHAQRFGRERFAR